MKIALPYSLDKDEKDRLQKLFLFSDDKLKASYESIEDQVNESWLPTARDDEFAVVAGQKRDLLRKVAHAAGKFGERLSELRDAGLIDELDDRITQRLTKNAKGNYPTTIAYVRAIEWEAAGLASEYATQKRDLLKKVEHTASKFRKGSKTRDRLMKLKEEGLIDDLDWHVCRRLTASHGDFAQSSNRISSLEFVRVIELEASGLASDIDLQWCRGHKHKVLDGLQRVWLREFKRKVVISADSDFIEFLSIVLREPSRDVMRQQVRRSIIKVAPNLVMQPFSLPGSNPLNVKK